MGKEKQIPLYMIYGSHAEQDKQQLKSYGSAIESMLASNPTGKVAVFLEDASCSLSELAFTTLFVNQGALPTEALVAVNFMSSYGRPPTRDELNAWKSNVLPKLNPFVRHQYLILDKIAQKYPGRIYMMPEWQKEEILSKILDEEGEIRTLTLKRKALELGYGGDFSTALPVFQEAVELEASNGRAREENILDMIKDELQEKDIIGFVSFIGAFHTKLSHQLQRNGYNVASIFPEKEEGIHLYDPFTSAARHRSFFPDKKPTQDEWMKILVQTIIYEALIVASTKLNSSFTEQSICNMVWDITQGFTMEDIKKLENEIQQNEVMAAVGNLLTR